MKLARDNAVADRRRRARGAGERQLQFLRQSARLEECGTPFLIRGMTWTLVAFVALFIGWASVTQIDEVAQAPGEIEPRGLPQIVQHLDGGLVQDIRVEDGSPVSKGDILLTLNGTGVREELERALIEWDGLKKNLAIAQKAYDIQQDLESKGASSRVRVLEMEKALANAESAESQQREIVARLKARMERLTVRAPVSGIVSGLMINTIGQVIKPGDTILTIVPGGRDLVADIQIQPRDRGHVVIGQPVRIKVASYDYSRFGVAKGRLEFISATTFTDEKGKKYYRGRVAVMQPYVGEHRDMKIMPGMTVQAGIFTGKKSILAYLLRPVQRAFAMALSEK